MRVEDRRGWKTGDGERQMRVKGRRVFDTGESKNRIEKTINRQERMTDR